VGETGGSKALVDVLGVLSGAAVLDRARRRREHHRRRGG
jgi:hypothetical protein